MSTISGKIHQPVNPANPNENWFPRTVVSAVYGLDATLEAIQQAFTQQLASYYTKTDANAKFLWSDLSATGATKTLTSSSVEGLTIRRTDVTPTTVIRYEGKVNGSNALLGYLGLGGVNTPVFRNTSGTNYTLWHTGNDGSGSGLDADLLDGKHYDDIVNEASANTKTTVLSDQVFSFRQTAGGALTFAADAMLLKTIKGNTVAWNQMISYTLSDWRNYRGLTITNTTFSATLSTEYTYVEAYLDSATIIQGHKYYCYANITALSNILQIRFSELDQSSWISVATTGRYSAVKSATANSVFRFVVTRATAASWSYTFKDLIFVDLTLLYGSSAISGLTDAQLLAKYESEFPGFKSRDLGSLLSLTSTTIKTVGVNLWDEEWHNSSINNAGVETAGNYIMSNHFIPVVAGETYYFKRPSYEVVWLYWYDENGNFVPMPSETTYQRLDAGTYTFTVNPGASKMLFLAEYTTYGKVYNHDFCINKSDSAINGSYYPYNVNYLPVDICNLTSGGVKVCPDGLLSAGSVYDEVVGNKLIKRVGSVDLSTLTWSIYSQVTGYRYCNFSKGKEQNANAPSNCKHSKYVSYQEAGFGEGMTADKVCTFDNGHIWVRDSELGSSGNPTGMFYYELATPIEYILDEVPMLTTRMNRYGTEAIYPANGEVPYTAPFRADIQYGATTGNLAADILDLSNAYTDYTKTRDALNQEFIFRKSCSDWADTGILKAIRGKSVAWNQYIPDNKIHLTGTGTGNEEMVSGVGLPIISGHKYLQKVYVKSGTIQYTLVRDTTNDKTYYSTTPIFTATASATCAFKVRATSGTSYDIYVNLTDLTLLYGAGKEPTSVAEFEATYNALYYPYNSGILLSNTAKSIESTGRNVWDGSGSENKAILYQTGYEYDVTGLLATGFIPVLPNTEYYTNLTPVGSAVYGLAYYDANKNYISGRRQGGGEWMAVFTTPSNCHYIRTTIASSEASTVIINLSDPSFNGQYLPYKKSVLNLNLDAIKVKSPNIWDEEMEIGVSINETTGQRDTSSTSANSSINYIPVLPNKEYYFKVGNTSVTAWRIFEYRTDKSYIGTSGKTSNAVFITGADTCFIKFQVSKTAYGTTYLNNITVNVSQAGINGNYFPYGILTFNGLKSAGTAYDEIKDGKLYKRIGEINLGNYAYYKVSEQPVFYITTFSDAKRTAYGVGAIPNIVCQKYIPSAPEATVDKSIKNTNDSDNLYIRDSAYSSYSVSQFKTAMSGVMAYYEKRNEQVFELAEPMVYTVYPEGTERFVYDSIPAIPVDCDIQYGTTKADLATAIDQNNNAILNIKDWFAEPKLHTLTVNSTLSVGGATTLSGAVTLGSTLTGVTTINGTAIQINSSGNVGIGTAATTAKLKVNGEIDCGGITCGGEAIFTDGIELDSTASYKIWYDDEYNRIVFTVPNGDYLYSTGGIISASYIKAGAIASSSDRALKEDIRRITAERAFSILDALIPSEWIWNDKNPYSAGKRGSGLVAQEVQSVLPDAVVCDGNEYLALNYNMLHAYEIKAIQDLNERVKALEGHE